MEYVYRDREKNYELIILRSVKVRLLNWGDI